MTTMFINGEEICAKAEHTGLSLLDFLRGVLGLTGAKRGCDEGTCRACTVLVNGEAKRACHLKVKELDQKRITTIEGLAADSVRDPIQQAFIECSAVQCGFCTPGQILEAKALLLKNPNPTTEDIKKALKFHLCRCGTYPRVIRAIERAAAAYRGENLARVPNENISDDYKIIGKSVPRVDIEKKVTGRTKFFADYYADDMLYGKIVWSQYPHAEIVSVDTKSAEAIEGVVLVLTAKEIPGNNLHGIIERDQPVLAEQRVKYIGEPIAVVFAEDEITAQRGADAVFVSYRELPGVFSIEEALAPNGPRIPSPEVGPLATALCGEKGNICKEVSLRKGDVEAAFAAADVIVAEEFYTPPEEHAWIETEGAVAFPREDGKVAVYAPNQCAFEDRSQLASILDVDVDDVQVVHVPAGGGFGGKTEMTTHAYVAIASMRTGRPAKMVLNRKESLRFHPKRHSFQMKYRIAAKASGKILGMKIKVLADGGAYISWSSVVLRQAVAFSTGPYHVPNLNVDATCVYTNNLVAGAMRGFGSSQMTFACESAIDILSRKLGMDPLRLREINALRVGLPAATGQVFRTGVGYPETIRAIREALTDELLPLRQQSGNIGIGIASGWKTVAGGIGREERAGAGLELLPDGKILLKTACTEMGQGSHTALSQIIAEILDIDITQIRVVAGDTAVVPFGGGVMASRGTYLYGHATLEAAKKMYALLVEKGAELLGLTDQKLALRRGGLVDEAKSRKLLDLHELARQLPEPVTVTIDFALPKSFPIFADGNESLTVPVEDYNVHHTAMYNTTAVAVEVNPENGRVKVLRCIVAADGGKIINPEAATTQVEGGVIMGMGYGLTSDFRIEQGINLTDTLAKCRIPSIDMVPEKIQVIFVEEEDRTGPFGAKGVGEVGLLAVAPAITNAVYDATGKRITRLPVSNAQRRLARGV